MLARCDADDGGCPFHWRSRLAAAKASIRRRPAADDRDNSRWRLTAVLFLRTKGGKDMVVPELGPVDAPDPTLPRRRKELARCKIA